MQPHFSKLRSFFWPVHSHELRKVLPMLLMFFFITFNYTILRDAKDTLLITAPGSGAEVIPFLKLWLVLPAAVLFMLLYAEMSNILSRPALFYSTLFPFLIFFGIFGFVLYPLRDSLHPHESGQWLSSLLPQGLSGLVAIWRNWSFALFYVFAELWGSVMLSLVFWGFANQITKVGEAKRFYNFFGLGGNIAPAFAGPLTVFLSNLSPSMSTGYGTTIRFICGTSIIVGLCIAGCYWWMTRNVLTDPLLYKENPHKPNKPKLGLKESFRVLSRSKYLGCIAILVITYGIAMNLIEVNWKSQVRMQYPDANDYARFMGHFSTWTGIASFIMVFLVGGNVIRRFGWDTAALVTPIVLLVTSICFFAFVLFQNELTSLTLLFGTSPLMLAVIFGAIQNIMSKSTKYSLFDPTKEMAYIPLDEESKVKGKAAIDVVGSRFGKSGGAFIQQGLLLGFGTVTAITPYVASTMFFVIAAWVFAARSLGRQFASKTT